MLRSRLIFSTTPALPVRRCRKAVQPVNGPSNQDGTLRAILFKQVGILLYLAADDVLKLGYQRFRILQSQMSGLVRAYSRLERRERGFADGVEVPPSLKRSYEVFDRGCRFCIIRRRAHNASSTCFSASRALAIRAAAMRIGDRR